MAVLSTHKLLLINGVPRTGKDTVAAELKMFLCNYGGFYFYQYSTIDPVRAFLEDQYDIDPGRKSPEDRRLLSDIALALDRHPDSPRLSETVKRFTNIMLACAGPHSSTPRLVFVTFIREVQSTERLLSMIRKKFNPRMVGIIRLLVTRPSLDVSKTLDTVLSNASDTDALSWPADDAICKAISFAKRAIIP